MIMSEAKTITNGKLSFEIVDHVPLGYQIWNIGKNMVPGYLPLCRLKYLQPYEGARQIEVDTLKAIQTEGAQIILAAVGGGENTIKAMEQYIQQHQKAENGSWEQFQVERMQKALPYMKQLRWDCAG